MDVLQEVNPALSLSSEETGIGTSVVRFVEYATRACFQVQNLPELGLESSQCLLRVCSAVTDAGHECSDDGSRFRDLFSSVSAPSGPCLTMSNIGSQKNPLSNEAAWTCVSLCICVSVCVCVCMCVSLSVCVCVFERAQQSACSPSVSPSGRPCSSRTALGTEMGSSPEVSVQCMWQAALGEAGAQDVRAYPTMVTCQYCEGRNEDLHEASRANGNRGVERNYCLCANSV